MRIKSYRKICAFSVAFCIVLTLTLLLPLPTAAAEWEKTYFGTPLEYYAGGEKTISVSDSSFDDWSSVHKVTVNSVEHPENWLNVHFEEITFRYAFAWDHTNLYVYVEIDKPFASLDMFRFYFNTYSDVDTHTYFIQLSYGADNGIYISRAKRGVTPSDPAFAASIGLHCAEIESNTYVEMSVPWAEFKIAPFTPEYGASLKYSFHVTPVNSGSYFFAQDASVLGADMPWVNAKKFLRLHLSDGTPALPVVTPKELEQTEVLKTSYKEINAALGKNYTGTIPTGWTNGNPKLLTEGSFQDLNTIDGAYMEGFRPTDFSEGAVTKTIDLSSIVSGLYKFEIGSAQIIDDRILFPSQALVYASLNGCHFQYLGAADVTWHISSSEDGKQKEIQKYTLVLDKGVTARYIKIKILAPESDFDIVPLSEVTAVYNADAALFPEESAIVSLGAKINPLQNGLRFGAKYNRVESKEVKQVGMLLYPTEKLGGSALNMEYYLANPYSNTNPTGVILVTAVNISASDYRAGKDFKDYESFVFFATLLNIPESGLSVNITAVPFVEYEDGEIIYGEPMVRNYNAVKSAADFIPE